MVVHKLTHPTLNLAQGYIDKHEASRVARALGCQPDAFWQVLKKYDAAGNRKLNLEEYA